MDSPYRGVACKILPIQREKVGNAVHQHGRDEPCIVYLHSSHRVPNNQPTPFDMDAFAVGQKPESGFDYPGSRIDLDNRQTKAVPVDWPGANVPELDQILRREAQLLATGEQCFYGSADDPVIGIGRLREAQENIRVSEEGHRSPQLWSW
jgi:hypothetical protein